MASFHNSKQNNNSSISTTLQSSRKINTQGSSQEIKNLKSPLQKSQNSKTSVSCGLTESLLKTLSLSQSLHSLKELVLDGRKIPYIFDRIEQPLVNMPNLISLSITYHQISKIENLSFLTQLKVLDLSHNQITQIERIESLKNLHKLDLSYNKIEFIPFQTFTRLQTLEILDLSFNQIHQFTELKSLFTNKKLSSLKLQGNQITEDNKEYLKFIEENLYWLLILDGKHFDEQNSKNAEKVKYKRAKSDSKSAKSQKKLVSLNFNLEKQIIDQTKKIKKQDMELINALEYVNGLEEELLNIKINSLYNQSSICSPRQINSIQFTTEVEPLPYTLTEIGQHSTISPQNPKTDDVIFKFPLRMHSASQNQGLIGLNPIQTQAFHTHRLLSSKKTTQSLFSGTLTPCIEEDELKITNNVNKNLNSAFEQTKTLEKSHSLVNVDTNKQRLNSNHKSPSSFSNSQNIFQKLQNKDLTIDQLHEYLQKLQQDQQSLINKQDLLKTKLQYKNETIKSFDYQLKDMMVKVMDLSQKINFQCDQLTNHTFIQSGSVINIIEERVQYIKKHLIWRIDIMKQKNKLQSVNQQIQMLNLESNFQKQRNGGVLNNSIILQKENMMPQFSTVMSQAMLNQLNQIINQFKIKQSKLEAKLQELENKLKLQSQLCKQELMDQSIYDFYSNLIDVNPAQKQLLKLNEYELQKCLKKFTKFEKQMDQKLSQLDQIVNHDQVQFIKEYKSCSANITDKLELIQNIDTKIREHKEQEQNNKITQLVKKIKNLEAEKKKIAQRLVIRRNENMLNKPEKEELDKLKPQIELIKSYYKDLINQDKPKQKNKNQKKNQPSLSPSKQNDSIVYQLLMDLKSFLKIVDELQKKEKQNSLNQLRQSQNINDLEAYLQSTTMISPSPRIALDTTHSRNQNHFNLQSDHPQQTSQNTNASLMLLKTFDNCNPIMTTTNTLQLNQNQHQILPCSAPCSSIHCDYEYIKSQYSLVKQQLVEIENERDQLQIECINKKEHYENIFRNIREQITEKESRYNQFFKEMQQNIQDLQKRNNEMILTNSELIKKVCNTHEDNKRDSGSRGLNESISQVKRFEWLLQIQSGIIEDLVRQKGQLEIKCQTQNLKNQHEIERISTNGSIDSRIRKVSTVDNRSQRSESFTDRQFQSTDLRQIQQQVQDNQKLSRDQNFNKNVVQTELTANTENNMIQHLFEMFQQNYLANSQKQSDFMQNLQTLETLQTQGTFNNDQVRTQTSLTQNNQPINTNFNAGLNQTQNIQDYYQSLNNSTQINAKSLKRKKSKDLPLQNRKSLTKPQSINQSKDSIRNFKTNQQTTRYQHSDNQENLLQQQFMVASPKILSSRFSSNENGNRNTLLTDQYQVSSNLNNLLSQQNTIYQNQASQNNLSSQNLKQYDPLNQSSIQLINNTNLLINNNDLSIQQLPLGLYDGQDSDVMTLNGMQLLQQINNNEISQQSMLNFLNGSSAPGAINSSGSGGGSNTNKELMNSSRYSLNNVWTVGIQNNQANCQILTSSLDQFDTQTSHATLNSGNQLQNQSIVQTFGKKSSIPLPPHPNFSVKSQSQNIANTHNLPRQKSLQSLSKFASAQNNRNHESNIVPPHNSQHNSHHSQSMSQTLHQQLQLDREFKNNAQVISNKNYQNHNQMLNSSRNNSTGSQVKNVANIIKSKR